jgi:hypothetical protein
VGSPEICSRPKSRPHAQPQDAYRRRRTRNIYGQSSTSIASLQDLILQFFSSFVRANSILHNPSGPPPETSQKPQNSAAEEPAHRNRASDQAFRGDLGIGGSSCVRRTELARAYQIPTSCFLTVPASQNTCASRESPTSLIIVANYLFTLVRSKELLRM